jgi:peptidoglycan/LPS O-acetylase OafA/YrhL
VAPPRSAHVPEVDWLKGLAILWVVCIHAKLCETTLFYEYGINRAVPIFLVLFGVTSELWWTRSLEAEPTTTVRRWYVTRFLRIVPPFWAMAAAWWACLLSFDLTRAFRVGFGEAVATFASYAPWIGTSWFVTILFQLVILFPALRWYCVRAGAMITLSATAALSSACTWHVWDIVAAGKWLLGNNVVEPGWYYAWIFVPRTLWPVAAGVFMARSWGGRPSARVSVAMAILTVLSAIIATIIRGNPHDPFLSPLKQQVIEYLADVPLSIALLGAFGHVPLPGILRRFLAWCGTHSWGIYLGHMLVHEALHMRQITPETGPTFIRAIYALFLFLAGAMLAAAGARLRMLIAGALARG